MAIKKAKLFVRSAYNYDTDAASAAAGLMCSDPSLARQEFQAECDINTIVKRFGLDGKMPTNVRRPMYGDFTSVNDFREALHAIEAARSSFASMPARVRARFENDPARFVEFCSNPANAAEAAELGLVDAPLPPVSPPSGAPPEAPVVPPTPA